ncbi:MAG: hypothetical protein QOE68_596 [Thermoanaerobaculia bacterium]|nr:hypothetical protein [Thermoanaerobaculia bacterium]
MANPREHVKDKGFWDGGDASRSENGQSGGRPSGFPGQRTPTHSGYRTDIDALRELPAEDEPLTTR